MKVIGSVASIAAGLLATTTMVSAQSAPPAASPPMSPDERALLARGEIGEGARIGGVAASLLVGLGTGHAIQGRWRERGWIFTFGELAGFAMAVVASAESDIDERAVNILGVTGFTLFLGLHLWEIVDAASGPERHNCRVRELRRRARAAPVVATPFVTPAFGGQGAIGGLTLRF